MGSSTKIRNFGEYTEGYKDKRGHDSTCQPFHIECMKGISAEITKCFQRDRVDGIIPELLDFARRLFL
jgi:hypothetical protein